jgi:ATP-dependent exoDNAse (exonuclease V) beta subunit
MAILVRENREGQKIAGYLLEKHIPVVSPDSLLLARIPLIRFLIDLLTFLDNPTDKIAEASIIYFLGLNKAHTSLAPTAIGDQFMAGSHRDISPEITEFFRRRDYLIRMPVYEVMEEVIRIFKLPETLDFKSMGYLQAFLDIVSTYTAENSVDFSSFLDWWEFNKDDYAVIVPETKPAVKIMSIHKAKGLEFPVVIIPYANWDHKMDKQLWLDADPPLPIEPSPGMPMPVNSSKLLEETFFKAAYYQEKEKVLIDNINLLYVAFTRARENLYIIARQKRNNENYDRLKESAVPMMQEDKEQVGHFTFGQPVIREKEKEEAREVEFHDAARLISNKWYAKITIRRKSTEFWRFDTGFRAKRRSWGLLVHQVLARIHSPGDVTRAVENALVSGDIDTTEKKILGQKIKEIFEIEKVKEWFEIQPKERVFIESPVITSEGALRPDRVIIGERKVVIVDFKTGKKNKAHIDQMVKYKEAVRGMGYEDIEAYILYLENKEVVGIEEKNA